MNITDYLILALIALLAVWAIIYLKKNKNSCGCAGCSLAASNKISTISDLIGNTPMVEFKNINDTHAKIFAKIEYFNPAGSAKDRIALEMIDDALKNGVIKPGATIIEPTSGNTGVAIASLGAVLGFKVKIVMPDTMSKERIKLIKAYGADVILTDGKLGMAGAVEKANELNKEIKNSFVCKQFENNANPKAHYKTTGPEIYNQTNSKVDIFVAGVGTGGTLSGVGKYLKEQNKKIKVVAVEPKSSPLLSENKSGPHEIQGIGANFIPDTLDKTVYDEIITVSNEDAINTAKEIAKKEGFLVGVSSGAALFAGIEIAKRQQNKDKNIVVLLPDSGDRYFSTDLFNN